MLLLIWPEEHLWPNAENWRKYFGDSTRCCLRCGIRENHCFAAQPCGWIPQPWLKRCGGCGGIITQRQATIAGRLFTCHLCGHVNHSW